MFAAFDALDWYVILRGIGLNVSVFLRRRHVMAADVDRAEIRVEMKRGRHDVGLAVGTRRCNPTEALATEILDLRVREFGHECIQHADVSRRVV